VDLYSALSWSHRDHRSGMARVLTRSYAYFTLQTRTRQTCLVRVCLSEVKTVCDRKFRNLYSWASARGCFYNTSLIAQYLFLLGLHLYSSR